MAASKRARGPLCRPVTMGPAELLKLIDRRLGTDLYYAQGLSRRVAVRVASGPERARVVLAGVLLGTRRWTRPVVLRLDGPDGPVPFVIPDHAALKVLDEIFCRAEYALELEEPPAAILDLGGHVGVACLFFRRRWPAARITTVEASPALVRALRRNVRPLDVEVLHAAVARGSGPVEFVAGAQSWGGRTREARPGGATVAGVSLDALLERPVDLVKVDIEGAELTAIPEAERLRNAKVIVGEIHAPSEAPETRALIGKLEGAGFEVERRAAYGFTLFTAARSA